jgi:anti-sigma factor RsiW
MSKDLQHIKEIDAYLSGNLTPESRNEFEEKLKADPNLQDELNTIRQVIEGIEGYGFKEMLKGIHKKQFGENKPNTK